MQIMCFKLLINSYRIHIEMKTKLIRNSIDIGQIFSECHTKCLEAY